MPDCGFDDALGVTQLSPALPHEAPETPQLLDRLAEAIASNKLTDLICNGPRTCFGQTLDTHQLVEIEPVFADDSSMRTELAQLALNHGAALNLANPIAEIVATHQPAGRMRIHIVLGSGVCALPLLSVRRHPEQAVDLSHLAGVGFVSAAQLELLSGMLNSEANFLIAGRTGAGKTTLLGAMLRSLGGRTVLIEEIPEIQLPPPSISLTQRAANSEGRGAITIQQLLVESLRMRPDRVVVGEVRGAELATLLQALNNGHRGSGATLHAASPELLVQRLLLLGMLAGLSPELTARLVSGGVDCVLQLDVVDGRRQLVSICRPILRHDTLEILPIRDSQSRDAA